MARLPIGKYFSANDLSAIDRWREKLKIRLVLHPVPLPNLSDLASARRRDRVSCAR